MVDKSETEFLRYLDPESKEKILQDLQKVYASAKNDDTNDGLDISLIPFLRGLNQIKGIVTIQSCIGHTYVSKEDDGVTYYQNGDLWIWPSEEMGKKFYERSPELAKCLGMEKITTYYSSWRQEIISILFDGITKKEGCKENNHEVAKEAILVFFKNLEKEVEEENKRR